MSEMRKLLETHRDAELDLAFATLTEFMIERANLTATEVGFKWIATPDAPNDYASLTSAYEHSVRTGAPLPISSENNDDVIYTSADGNVAFRFVHDVHHVKLGQSFEVVDELDLARWHLNELERLGFETTSLPWKVLHADLIGQALVVKVSGSFPPRQRNLVRGCLLGGFERGLIAEARQIAVAGVER